ncbi:16S rRNA processing protein RimM [Actinotalea ferrariae CF5-4]|uniref:Ribosome maturation factor RimM n=1 Tax=Actinotalea ferrariae CF5-4 TaxID=948458 RepID=A0A021VP94_9CELL|nr:ribosome maturation factor RimM [Actinotalea ferrariae]EYR62938.1 16S rRNA processing protein RimM [Actinotalea ferrariae CF5-4]
MQLTVATLGRPHGLRGEIALDVRTDRPEDRFAVGAVLQTVPAAVGPLTVRATRVLNGRWHATFEEVTDRTRAEEVRGVELVVEADVSDEDDAWYPHELVGLRAERPDGTVVGEVVGLEHLPAQDALVLREPDGARTLVPFVRAIVPVVDVPGGRVVVDAPHGLLAADAVDGAVDDAVVDAVVDADAPGSDEA